MIAEITPTERLSLMLRDIESEGFHLYYDEKNNDWEMMNPESEFSVRGNNKEQVIFDGWRGLMFG